MVYRLTPAGRLEACAPAELRAGDIFTRSMAEQQRSWLLAEINARGALRSRPADELMAGVQLLDETPWVRAVAGDEDEPEVDVPDHETPRAALVRAEDSAEAGEQRTDIGAMADVFGSFMRYAYADGAHMAHVMRRVFALVIELEPKLVGGLDGALLGVLRGEYQLAHYKRIELAIAGTRLRKRLGGEHDAVIEGVLRQAAARRCAKLTVLVVRPPMTLGELLAIGAAEELPDYERRMEALRRLVGFLFWEGSRPGVVVRRLYCLAKWRPADSALLLDMSLAQLGTMFGETRAAWSWRVRQVINRFLDYAQVRGTQGSFQKSASACAKYAEVQEGNCNRRGGRAPLLRAAG